MTMRRLCLISFALGCIAQRVTTPLALPLFFPVALVFATLVWLALRAAVKREFKERLTMMIETIDSIAGPRLVKVPSESETE